MLWQARAVQNLLKHTSLLNSRQQTRHAVQLIIIHPEDDIISNKDDLALAGGSELRAQSLSTTTSGKLEAVQGLRFTAETGLARGFAQPFL